MAREKKIKVVFVPLPKKPAGMDKAKWNPGPKKIELMCKGKPLTVSRGSTVKVPQTALLELFKQSKKALAAKHMTPYVPLEKGDLEADPFA